MIIQLDPGETLIREGRAGFGTNFNRGHLALTNKRLIWERSLSIDPFSGEEAIIELKDITSCEAQGDVIVLEAAGEEVYLLVDWLPLSILSGNRRAKEWLRDIRSAIIAAQEASSEFKI
jgi:hypothetical protein